MDARDLFLEQHAAVHSATVGGNRMSAAERTFGGVTDEQMRLRPREDMNSLAWLLWHVARAEDVFVNAVLAGRAQVWDAAWMQRLAVTRRDFGIGMTSAEVDDLTRTVALGALREYRDAVGRRTREIVAAFTERDWEGVVAVEAVQRACDEGAFGTRAAQLVKAFPGRPRAALLSGIALLHAAAHMGEASTVRSSGGFGTGI